MSTDRSVMETPGRMKNKWNPLRSREIPNFSFVIKVAAGNYFSIALKTDGVWTWGKMKPDSWEDVVVKDTGISFSTALKSDGTVWAWGTNSELQKEYLFYVVCNTFIAWRMVSVKSV